MNMPSYIPVFEQGILSERILKLERSMEHCCLCPRKCGVNRMAGETGFCRSGSKPVIASYNPHFGEENPLVGKYGSGTIFFTNCNLACVFCQNYDISQLGYGHELDYPELAKIMIDLQNRRCHNINLVSPSHMIYPIFKSLEIAIEKGLRVPIVYNTGGYDSVETLRLCEGLIDIYMPDIKYMDNDTAETLSGVPDYPERVKEAITEMHRQVGDLETDSGGIALRGLIVRHLVLPSNKASSEKVFQFLAKLSKDTYVNIMNQYRPEYRAKEYADIGRRVTLEEYDWAVDQARKAGLWRFAR